MIGWPISFRHSTSSPLMSHLLSKPLASAILVPCFLSLGQLSLSLTKAAFSSSRNLSMDSSDSQHFQNVVVMRHGDRLDNCEPLWLSTAARPWDPPLAAPGKVRAFCTGRRLRSHLGFPIHRVFVSPFLRCIQTVSEVISALCAVVDDPANMTGEGVAIDPSKLKVWSGLVSLLIALFCISFLSWLLPNLEYVCMREI